MVPCRNHGMGNEALSAPPVPRLGTGHSAIVKIRLFRNPVSGDDHPLAPALPPSGAGAHVMSRNFLYRNSLRFGCG